MGPCPRNSALRGEYQGDPRDMMLTLRRCDQGRRRKEPTGKTVPPQVYLIEQRFTVGSYVLHNQNPHGTPPHC